MNSSARDCVVQVAPVSVERQRPATAWPHCCSAWGESTQNSEDQEQALCAPVGGQPTAGAAALEAAHRTGGVDMAGLGHSSGPSPFSPSAPSSSRLPRACPPAPVPHAVAGVEPGRALTGQQRGSLAVHGLWAQCTWLFQTKLPAHRATPLPHVSTAPTVPVFTTATCEFRAVPLLLSPVL